MYTLGKNRTVIIIAHRLSTIKNANQIVVLNNGQIVEIGSHDELLLLNNHYAKLWNMQITMATSSMNDLTSLDQV